MPLTLAIPTAAQAAVLSQAAAAALDVGATPLAQALVQALAETRSLGLRTCTFNAQPYPSAHVPQIAAWLAAAPRLYGVVVDPAAPVLTISW